KAGLRFARWLRQAPYSVRCGVMLDIPQSSQIAELPQEEQYAAIELFRGTMIRHSAVLYRDDCPSGMERVDFDGDGWMRYVPIRLPDTISAHEPLPFGAAAVLVNRSHTYRDLFLPIDQAEERILDAIDGESSIGEIVERVFQVTQRQTQLEPVRSFFERLWW